MRDVRAKGPIVDDRRVPQPNCANEERQRDERMGQTAEESLQASRPAVAVRSNTVAPIPATRGEIPKSRAQARSAEARPSAAACAAPCGSTGPSTKRLRSASPAQGTPPSIHPKKPQAVRRSSPPGAWRSSKARTTTDVDGGAHRQRQNTSSGLKGQDRRNASNAGFMAACFCRPGCRPAVRLVVPAGADWSKRRPAHVICGAEICLP